MIGTPDMLQRWHRGTNFLSHISRRKVNPVFDLRLCKLHSKILLLRFVSRRADLKQSVWALGVLELSIKTWLAMILRGLLYFEQLHDEIQLSNPNFTNTCQLCTRPAKQARQAVEIPKTMSNNKTPAVPCPRPCWRHSLLLDLIQQPAFAKKMCNLDPQDITHDSKSKDYGNPCLNEVYLVKARRHDKQQCSKELIVIVFDIQSKLGKRIVLITHALILEFW